MTHAETLQQDLICRMTPGRRLEIAQSLYVAAWEIKVAFLHRQHPQWSEDEIQSTTRRIFLTGDAGA